MKSDVPGNFGGNFINNAIIIIFIYLLIMQKMHEVCGNF